ncbi:hypothetical protein BGZ94_000802 [Podila epigama]|nr:hypothetical protein BGZ94_000802 [Podila epigama]
MFYVRAPGSTTPLSVEQVDVAIQELESALGISQIKIDHFILSLPHQSFDENGLDESEVTAFSKSVQESILPVWKKLSELRQSGRIGRLGVAEFSKQELEILKGAAEAHSLPGPEINQVNLQDCCVLPKDLINYSKEHQIELLTHGDATDILPSATFSSILKPYLPVTAASALSPNFVLKYSALIAGRGLVAKKGYVVDASPPMKQLPAIARFFHLVQFVPERATTSYIVSPKGLLLFRVICSLYATAVGLENVISNKGLFFVFFTNQSYTGLTAYLWVMSYHSYKYCQTGKTDSIASQHWSLTLGLWLLYATALSYHIEIPVIYWSVLYNGSSESIRDAWRNISVHILDLAMILTELCLNRMQLNRRLVIAPITGTILFMIFSWVIDGIFGFWVYPFMKLELRVLYIYPALIFLSAIAFSIMYGINHVKERLFERDVDKEDTPEVSCLNPTDA